MGPITLESYLMMRIGQWSLYVALDRETNFQSKTVSLTKNAKFRKFELIEPSFIKSHPIIFFISRNRQVYFGENLCNKRSFSKYHNFNPYIPPKWGIF